MIDRRFVLASLLAVSLAPLRAHAESTEVLDTVVDGLDRPWSFAFLPDGTILVELCTISCEIDSFKPRPVSFLIPLIFAPNSAQHSGPWFIQN